MYNTFFFKQNQKAFSKVYASKHRNLTLKYLNLVFWYLKDCDLTRNSLLKWWQITFIYFLRMKNNFAIITLKTECEFQVVYYGFVFHWDPDICTVIRSHAGEYIYIYIYFFFELFNLNHPFVSPRMKLRPELAG